MIFTAIIISANTKNIILIFLKFSVLNPIISGIPIKTNIIATIVFNLGNDLNIRYSNIGIKTKYDETTLDIVVESIPFDPNNKNKLYAKDSTDKIAHCEICFLSILNNSLKKINNNKIKLIDEVINKNSNVLILVGTPLKNIY